MLSEHREEEKLPENERIPLLDKTTPGKVLWIGPHLPEPTSSAAGERTLSLLEALSEKGHSVHLASAVEKSSRSISEDRYSYEFHSIELNRESFQNFIRHLQPQIVVFDRFMTEEQFSWRVREVCPEALLLSLIHI